MKYGGKGPKKLSKDWAYIYCLMADNIYYFLTVYK